MAEAVVQNGKACTLAEPDDCYTNGARCAVRHGFRLGPHKVVVDRERETYLDSPVAYEYLGEELTLI